MAKPLVIDESKYNTKAEQKSRRTQIRNAVKEGRGWTTTTARAGTVWYRTGKTKGNGPEDLKWVTDGHNRRRAVSVRKSALSRDNYRQNPVLQQNAAAMRAGARRGSVKRRRSRSR